MIALTMKNVRCFADPKPAPLAPLTLLVGENSTGKSTFLASIRLASDLAHDPTSADFNKEPFLLGSYDDIANYPGSRWRADTFSVGFSCSLPKSTMREIMKRWGVKLTEDGVFLATFKKQDSLPVLAQWQFLAMPYGMTVTFRDTSTIRACEFVSPDGHYTLSGPPVERLPVQHAADPWYLTHVVRTFSKEDTIVDITEVGKLPNKEHFDAISFVIRKIREELLQRPYATAPIRTRPRRTYDPLSVTPEPEGGHVPMILAKTLSGKSKQRVRLQKALETFGKASGLYSAVKIKRLGRKEGTPFQVKLNFGGQPDFNLTDVGYGVSQALPIVVDIIRAEKGSTLLIQQPEVHLHPRAQAALGSLLIQLAVTENKRFIVETHSDYLIDRVRMDIRDSDKLSPKDVQILYFERQVGGNADIHPLELDKQGNITNAPPGYRDFFLREEHRFIGV